MGPLAKRTVEDNLDGVQIVKVKAGTYYKYPDIVAAVANKDYTIDVTFANGVRKRYDMKPLFADARLGKLYRSIMRPDKFINDIKFDATAVYWNDKADIAESAIWHDGETL